jgi:Alpha/beta hydrolase domain
MNRVNITPVYDAALQHLNRWINGGEAPPRQPLINFSGDPAEIVRDGHGIATGGIRLPQVVAPTAVNSAIALAPDIFSLLRGSCAPFTADGLTSLYADEDTFIAQFTEAARAAEKSGVILARDVAPMIDEARRDYRRAYEVGQ